MSSKEFDLRDQCEVSAFFEDEKIYVVIDPPARVGDILANNNYPYQFLMDNIKNSISNDIRLKREVYLGNLDAKCDWGHAQDFVRMMWMIFKADTAEDWVNTTEKTMSSRDFVEWLLLK